MEAAAELTSPPLSGQPQARSWPSAVSAAKANWLACKHVTTLCLTVACPSLNYS